MLRLRLKLRLRLCLRLRLRLRARVVWGRSEGEARGTAPPKYSFFCVAIFSALQFFLRCSFFALQSFRFGVRFGLGFGFDLKLEFSAQAQA